MLLIEYRSDKMLTQRGMPGGISSGSSDALQRNRRRVNVKANVANNRNVRHCIVSLLRKIGDRELLQKHKEDNLLVSELQCAPANFLRSAFPVQNHDALVKA